MIRLSSIREIRAGARWAAALNGFRSVHCPSFGTVDADEVSGSRPAEVRNLVQGKWKTFNSWNAVVDPLNGDPFIRVSEVPESEIEPFVESLSKCPKYGLHNPLRAQERLTIEGKYSPGDA